MKVLVVGSGGREHALVWKIAQSPHVRKVFCAPGNAGIGQTAACVPIEADDVSGLLDWAQKKRIDLTVVGPEGPLSAGIVDRFDEAGLRIFGSGLKASRIEASKSFAKNLMLKHGIPTADGRTFTSYSKAEAYIRSRGAPIVVKADGLAAGKGVIVCNTIREALAALRRIMVDRVFGEAGRRAVVEDRLTGEEASFLAFTDGKTVLPLPSSQDHKAIFDDDRGPNTGGMGAYSPAPVVDRILHRKIMNTVMRPTVRAMAAEGCPYKGVLYAGLMISGDQVRVLEFNARFGDPEAQPLLMRLQSDIVPILQAVIDERLHECSLRIDPRAAVCVVMASEGYPGKYPKGMPISGLRGAGRMKDVVVFHAGTETQQNQVVTSGGRVLGVTALGDPVARAITRAYQAVSKISWKGACCRSDIGRKALRRMEQTPDVAIVMGSDSDLEVMEEAAAVLKKFEIPYRMTVASAHRSPRRAGELAASALSRGLKVIIAGAGHAAHLAGVLAAYTVLPVIGVPIDSSALRGMDALLATVQMPPGVPVATMAVGKPGARNAGLLAVQILALSDAKLSEQLQRYKDAMTVEVEDKAQRLEQDLQC